MWMFMPLFSVAQEVTSPDGRYVVKVDGMTYSVTYNSKVIIQKSRLGVDIDNRLFESALGVPRGEHKDWSGALKLSGVDSMRVDTCLLYTSPSPRD